MKIPFSWLKEHINTSSKPEHIARTLTMLGLEVDTISFEDLGFNDVVVAKILTIKKHPEAETLFVLTLFDGTQEYQVVTSAPNCFVGMKTAYGKLGATLPGNVILKEKSFKGIFSQGALLSYEELGIPGGREGVMEFDQHIKEGSEVRSLFAEPIFELSLTPNLIHAASIRGTARELSAGEISPLLPLSRTFEVKNSQNISNYIEVSVEEPKSCPRYCCCIIENVQVAPSPPWLKKRLEAAGMRSINNVVDITNYVMLELGQPLHAFDFNKIEGGKLCVRKGKEGEKLQTLDGSTHSLTEEILLIASATAPLAIAGVMGGAESEVTEKTTTLLLESAYFDPTQIRRSAKITSIHSEASYRVERGCDPNATLVALNRAARLIEENCQGKVAPALYDSHPELFSLPEVTLRLQRVQKLLGIPLPMHEVENLLKRIDLNVVKVDADTITLQPPSYRHDIKEEIDLIEEVARLYGYHNLIPKEKQLWRKGVLASSPTYLFETKIRNFLLQCNLQEIITCNLISPLQSDLIPSDVREERTFVRLLNPSSIDHSIMRASLLPGMLATCKNNFNHEIDSLALFEVGRIHFAFQERFIEPSMAAILLTGSATALHWQNKEREVDFYDLKGIVEALFKELHIKITFKPSHFSNLHPKRQAQIICGERNLGVIGEVHPLILQKVDISKRTYFAEIYLEESRLHAEGVHKMEPLPLYPTSKRDWTLALSTNSMVDEIFALIKKFSSFLLESVSLIDIYENEKLGSNMMHATFRFCYRDPHRTLSMQEVEKEHATITENVLLVLEKGKL